MVKKLTMQAHVDFAEPQAVFAFLFGDDKFMKKYHGEVSEDSHAEVSRWSAEGERLVKFATPLNAPSVVKRLVGAEILRITDTQRYSKVGNRFRIQSDPVVNIPGGERFCTSAEIIIEPGYGKKGTLVTINVALEFKAGVWGIQGTMENFMEDQARRSFKGWIKMGKEFCQEELEKSVRLVHSPSGSDESEYHDLERLDSGSPNPSKDAPRSVITLGGAGGGQQHLEIWFVNSVLRELNGIQMSTKVSKAHLEMLLRKVQKLEDELQVIRFLVQQRRPISPLRQTTWALCSLGAAAAVYLAVRHAYLRGHQQ